MIISKEKFLNSNNKNNNKNYNNSNNSNNSNNCNNCSNNYNNINNNNNNINNINNNNNNNNRCARPRFLTARVVYPPSGGKSSGLPSNDPRAPLPPAPWPYCV